MKTKIPVCPLVLTMLAIARLSVSAEEVSVPDPGLNAAIRQALQKPDGPLTDQDLLSLTNLDASRRKVGNIDGLQAAGNLISLNLEVNHLAAVSLPIGLTNLEVLNISSNPLTNFFLPNGLTNLNTLTIGSTSLSQLDLPNDLNNLNRLDLSSSDLTSFDLPTNLTRLEFLDLSFNLFTNFALPNGLTNLDALNLGGNLFTNLALPADLTSLSELNLEENKLTSLTLPTGMTNLSELDLSFNQLTNLTLPSDLERLAQLELDSNQFSDINFLVNLTNLVQMHLRDNQLANFSLPAELTALTYLDVSENPLIQITLPAGQTNLATLRLTNTKLTSLRLPVGLKGLSQLNLSLNQLTNVELPQDLGHLVSLNLDGNQLASFKVPSGLTNLTGLFLTANQLTNLTLAPDMTSLTEVGFLGNPLTSFVLPDFLAVTNLAETVSSMQSQGVSVFAYPVVSQLVRPRQLVGAIQFGITGPPGVYTVLESEDLTAWSVLGDTTNNLGSIAFTDVTAHLSSGRFYRALLQTPPTNMVFISPKTFTMGSPATEQDRNLNEGPQTAVTLSHGFWIGRYEVTQGEYLAIMNTNPSFFPGDLSRPISSVSWFDATNYCWALTLKERAAGYISAISQYRLPTEAEWECAARAGTSTRFSYGDDPNYASITNHAWLSVNGDLTVHPVGQKLPNPWGLYDMEGNVWEWCQDWFGPLPGGAVVDPKGPDSNTSGLKVIRGGAYDYFQPDCRSARRLFFAAHPLLTDTDLGFRVVLVTEP